jgi:pantoate--beta-alanine ligase
MYPFGTMGCVQMHVPGITDILDGFHRPGTSTASRRWWRACSTWCSRRSAVFGRKDYQQLQVIRYMTTEMSFPVEILPAPTLREADGPGDEFAQPVPAGRRARTAVKSTARCADARDARRGASVREVEDGAARG